jgi:hypothetical protein
MHLVLQSVFVHTSQVIFTCRKFLRHGASGFTSPPKEGALRIIFSLKNTPPRTVLNPRPLDPMASTLTIIFKGLIKKQTPDTTNYTEALNVTSEGLNVGSVTRRLND